MAAYILFPDDRTWFVTNAGFNDVMRRAIERSGGCRDVLGVIFNHAQYVRRLDIQGFKDSHMRVAVLENVLWVAREQLDEYRKDPNALEGNIAGVQKLTQMTEENLAMLQREVGEKPECQ